jgi:hypothetical protein
MTRRRLLLIASLPLAVVVVFGVLAMLPARPGVTKANFDRIEVGMATTDVENLFGVAGDAIAFGNPPRPRDQAYSLYWFANDGSVAWVRFADDRTTDKKWEQSRETTIGRIRRWLRLD